eukprot:1087119-Prorocentrum_lima.AAC.1
MANIGRVPALEVPHATNRGKATSPRTKLGVAHGGEHVSKAVANLGRVPTLTQPDTIKQRAGT